MPTNRHAPPTLKRGWSFLPLLTIRQNLASALHLICYQARMCDGNRRMLKIAEVRGLHGDNIVTQDIFEFVQTGLEDGKIVGRFRPTGVVPSFMHRLATAGVDLPASIFTDGV